MKWIPGRVKDSDYYVNYDYEMWGKVSRLSLLKGKLGDFFLFVQSFYWPKTKTSFNRQFSPKRPKLVKNQAKGSEIHQIRTKWHPSYCGNPSILSSDLAVKIKRSLQGSPVGNTHKSVVRDKSNGISRFAKFSFFC